MTRFARTVRAALILALFALLRPLPAIAADLPNPTLTPGATRGVDLATICTKGSAKAARHTPASVKAKAYAEYGIRQHKPGDYEVDHLISLELGGADALANLWPQSYRSQPWNAHVKDRLENYLHAEVCAGRMPLAEAQHAIANDWISAYRHFLGAP